MKTILAASVLALITSTSAFASGLSSANIDQIAVGLQKALNEITDATSVNLVDQDAVNAANLVNLEDVGGVDTIEQSSAVWQKASNSIGSFKYGTVNVSEVTQEATNVTNSITLGDADASNPEKFWASVSSKLDSISQSALIKQSATNDIGLASSATDFSQSAVNAANLVSVNFKTPDLESVTQHGVGSQYASNNIDFKYIIDANLTNTDGVIPSTQDATNVVNSVTAEKVTKTLSQFSATSQVASNVADSYKIGSKVWDFDQSAVNAANLVQIGDINDNLDISQTAFAAQLATNSLDVNGTVSNVAQSATNVANSISNIAD